MVYTNATLRDAVIYISKYTHIFIFVWVVG